MSVRFGSVVSCGVLGWAAGAFAGESVTVKVTPDPKACTVVHLPRWKRAADPDWMDAITVCDYDFRSRDGGILVGAYCQPLRYGERIYSPSKYAVSFGSGRVRKATDTEWNLADPYVNFRVTANYAGHEFAPHQKLIYQGKVFPRTGLTWPLADAISHVSHDGDFLAVNSWDGMMLSNGDDNPLMARAYMDGTYYVDIYETDSAQRALAIQGHFHGIDPYYMFYKSAWISKRYFVLPLDWQQKLRNFVICDVARAAESLK